MSEHNGVEASRGSASVHWGNVVSLPDSAMSEHVAWLRRRSLSEDTIRLREVALSSVIAATGKPLLACTPDDIDSWDRSLTARAKPLTDASRSTYHAQMHAFFAWAVVHGKLERDPSVRLVSPRLPHRQPRPISESDLTMALMTAPARIAPWLELAAFAGFRAGEIARLSREDVHDELAIPVLVAQGKGSKERVIPMAPRVWVALQVAGLPADGYVFARHDGEPGPIQSYRVSQLASAHLHSVGVPCTLHQLRHRFLTEVYRATRDLRLTQELAGHASPTTTAGYTAWSPEAAALAVFELGNRTASSSTRSTA